MWIRSFLLSILTVLIFFALLITFGWLDIGEQTNWQIVKNIFVGNYLFFSVPIFILGIMVYSSHKEGINWLIMRMLIVILVSLAVYAGVVRFLITRLDGS